MERLQELPICSSAARFGDKKSVPCERAHPRSVHTCPGARRAQAGPMGLVLGGLALSLRPPALPPCAVDRSPPGTEVPQPCTSAPRPALLSALSSSPAARSSRCKPPCRLSFLPPKPVRLEQRGARSAQTAAPPPTSTTCSPVPHEGLAELARQPRPPPTLETKPFEAQRHRWLVQGWPATK